MIWLVEEVGKIACMPYELMLKTLDHIEVGSDGGIEVIFLAGVKIKSELLINYKIIT